MLYHIIAGIAALVWSLRYQCCFQLKPGERVPYLCKSFNLALCYRAFDPQCRLNAAWGAGKAAFFCCAYDVVSDWRKFEPEYYLKFDFLLKKHVSIQERQLAVDLYWNEKNHSLAQDGLARGPAALEFITKVMKTENYVRKNVDFNQFGTVCQIVDDVLDFEEDKRNHEMNCLFSEKYREYLLMLINYSSASLEIMFPYGTVFLKVFAIAQKKAEGFLANGIQSSEVGNNN